MVMFCLLNKGQAKELISLGLVSEQVKIADKLINVEIADTQEKRVDGLKWRNSMPQNSGMLFIYDNDRLGGFWMRDTLIDLDIAFIDKKGFIVGVDTMKSQSSKIYKPEIAYRYVLELNAGFFKQHKIGVGEKVTGWK